MNGILIFLALFPALFGAYCVMDFLYVRASGKIVEAVVTGFSTKKDKGRILPLVSYQDEAGTGQKLAVEAIDQISYFLSPAIEREIINVVILPGGRSRVYGYLGLTCGALAFLPLLAALGAGRGDAGFLNGQIVFVLLFIVAAIGGWGILRTISRLR